MRLRDAAQGEPLRALLAVIAEQVGVVEDNLDQLYDDLFVETCADWVVPYLGDLIGVQSLNGAPPQVASPRAEVANTIGYRRRKGTIVMLQQLARDVTGWDARAVEFFQLLGTTQYLNHIRPNVLRTPDLRLWEPLERMETAFNTVAHVADVRHIASGRGRYNIADIGLFLFRLSAFSVTDAPACPISQTDRVRYLFNALGRDTPLFSTPQTQQELSYLAQPVNVPMPISRRVLKNYLGDYYGPELSVCLSITGANGAATPVDAQDITVCDLSDFQGGWAHTPPTTNFAIDPILGRIACKEATTGLRIRYSYGFSARMGGGEYDRSQTFDTFAPTPPAPLQSVPTPNATITQALAAAAGEGIVEIDDSGRYEESPLSITLKANQRLELRAANNRRPTIVLTSDIQITGDSGADVTLNGLLIAGGAIHISGQIQRVRLRHCTLAPGLTLSTAGDPQSPTAPSIIVDAPTSVLELDHCITGGLRVIGTASVLISDSIVDATAEDNVAFAAGADPVVPSNQGGGTLRVVRSTIIGKVWTTSLELASNVILLASLASGDTWAEPVISDRLQEGCARYSYIPAGARVPRRYHCQPASDTDAAGVRPVFTSLRYGDPGYCQLSQRCAPEILMGADDESEMGAFHDLFQPQRLTNLRIRLDEYLRFGLEAGVIFAT
jgi:hypothetical protein